MKELYLLVFCLFFFSLSPVDAQRQEEEPAHQGEEDILLRIFLDCGVCDVNYLREQLSYVHFVRDLDQCDVHILITSQRTGGNGLTHQIEFLGRHSFAGQEHKLELSELPNATIDERRQGISRRLELGLIPYWMQTRMADQLKVDVEAQGPVMPKATSVDDPWNRWTFQVAGGGSFNKEASRSAFTVWGNLAANRVTEEWRMRNNASMRYDERTFKTDEGDILSAIRRKSFETYAVRSINDHWSAGLSGGAFQSTFDNMALYLWTAPAVEYSIFPYREVNRRELTVSYRIGYSHRNYEQLTIFQKMQEDLWNHSLEFAARIRQPWGSLFASVEGSHFFDDISKHRLEVDGSLNLRITGGLTLDVGGDMAFISDQRSLPAGGASLEDLLLAQRQLATNYRFSGSIGLRYTFGSIYDNVVNTRL